ncbi:hypothetical protein [Streptomyces sp. NPDC058953]|uniref:hypothetical protein n=1 Tax=unclassified Streptomyces TaxID=2593676 RepID=UPI003673890F
MGVVGALTQFALRFVTFAVAALVTALIFIRPNAALLKGAVMIAVVLVLYGLRLAWRAVMSRRGGGRCLLHADGVAVTGPFGGVRDAVPWREAATLRRMTHVSLFLAIHRFEIGRHGRRPLVLIALGAEPALVGALEAQAARNGLRY